MKPHTWILAITLTLPSSYSWSASADLSAEYERCEAQSQSETPALRDCLGSEYERQDKRLNVAYVAALASLSPKKADELRKVQRAWLGYVENQCGFLYDNDNYSGSMDRLRAQYCEVEERARRADYLEHLARP